MSKFDLDNKTNSEMVSIIMPNYNSAEFLKETLESVISQSYQNWELIIVDDCSNDNFLEIIENYKDTRIKLIRNASNSGAAVSRNKAIAQAQGRWIAFLDSDDVWEQDKLSKHIAFMLKNDSAFSCTDYLLIDSTGEPLTKFIPKKDKYSYKDILKHCAIGCSTVIYDSQRIGKAYMPENAEKREDFACWLQILKQGIDVVCFHECLTKYRIRSNSVSAKKTKMVKYQWNVYRKVEKLSWFKSIYYLMNWAIRGVLKYR